MESSGILIGLLCISLVSVMCSGQSREVSAEDFDAKKSPDSTEKDLLEAMEELLVKFQSRPSTEKRGSIPLCGVGDRCAVRLGPRIGKLCDCAGRRNCNSFLLKCL
ncbi:cocaine- and amphetamine-regulated transcript-like [Conger conger]|uniref:cocaine- and amphetamine-regulated transcript-like n=1 Tax=Conger conger TaxID=82655 RepID=UPI002A5AA046|nr:cocaine- and amphetamine-regulated transcript-like [Conger conger]